MKNFIFISPILVLACALWGCTQGPPASGESPSAAKDAALNVGQSGVQDDVSQQNILQIAAGSKDHSTLVTAVKAAGLVDVLANAGPFTVFAPTNEAFGKLPKETLDGLLKPENKDALSDILEYHVYVGVIKTDQMRDGQKLNQVNLKNVVVNVNEGKITLNAGTNIIASIPASNGIIHVVDGVLLPPEK